MQSFPKRHMMLKKWILVVFVALFIILLTVDRAWIGSPVTPKSQLDVPFYAERFKDKEILIQKGRSSYRLLFVGDSLFQQLDSTDVWQHYYCNRNALNLGFAGDTTANVLWRIQSGEMDGLSPSLVVLLVGTNNLGIRRWSWSVASDVQGIDEVVSELHSHLPGAHIILLGILPLRGHESGWIRHVDYLWKARTIKRINGDLAEQFGRGTVPYVTYIDLTAIFLKDGLVDISLLADRIHPTPKGRALIASALEPQISHILGDIRQGGSSAHGERRTDAGKSCQTQSAP
jgi:lysophospholipase L1-like esterase